MSSEVIVSINQGIRNYEFQVARVASDGSFTYYTITELFNPNIGPSIATGSDGAVYVQDSEHIAKVTPAGQITVYSTASNCLINPPVWLHSLTLGPDGNMWFISNCSATYPGNNLIGNITPSGAITTFPLTTLAQGLASGTDGAIWFTNASYEIGRITTSGSVTYTAIPTKGLPDYTYGCVGTPDYSSLTSIIPGPKGTLEFIGMTEVSGGAYNCTYVGSFTPIAPDADQLHQASSVLPDKVRSESGFLCGPGGVKTCVFSVNLSDDNLFSHSAYIGDVEAFVTYTAANDPTHGWVTKFQRGDPFGLCNVTNGNGGTVTMNPGPNMPVDLGVTLPAKGSTAGPVERDFWFFPALSAKTSGAAQNVYATCVFDFLLMQSVNGSPFAQIGFEEIHVSGRVGP